MSSVLFAAALFGTFLFMAGGLIWAIKGRKPAPSIEQAPSDTPATRARFLYDDDLTPVAWVHPDLRDCIEWHARRDIANGRPIDYVLRPMLSLRELIKPDADAEELAMRRVTLRAMVWKHRYYRDAWTAQISKEDLAHYLHAYPECELLP